MCSNGTSYSGSMGVGADGTQRTSVQKYGDTLLMLIYVNRQLQISAKALHGHM